MINFPPAQIAGIDHILFMQIADSIVAPVQVLALILHWPGIGNVQKVQISENSIDKMRFASGAINIINPQQHIMATCLGDMMGEHGRIAMPQMQESRRRGGKARDITGFYLSDQFWCNGDGHYLFMIL